MDDAALLRNFVETGSDQAFDQLVARHFDLVYASALRLLGGDAHLAQDVAQCVFTDLARKAARLPQGLFLGGWLYRHTCFTAANAVRAERRRAHRERRAADMTHDSTDSDDIWLRLAPALDEAMRDLKSSDRDAIVLRFFDRQPFQAVGEALGLSEDAARKRVDRALDKMRGFFVARGLGVSALVLADALETHAAAAAPAGLSSVVATAALAGAAKGGGAGLLLTKIMAITKTQIALAGLLAVLTAIILLQWTFPARMRPATLDPASPAGEETNIAYNFKMPASTLLSFYAVQSREKVRAPLDMPSGALVSIKTPRPVTRTAALKLMRDALMEQAQITLARSSDGTLLATPKQTRAGPPHVGNATITYLPDGQVDPPAPPLSGPSPGTAVPPGFEPDPLPAMPNAPK